MTGVRERTGGGGRARPVVPGEKGHGRLCSGRPGATAWEPLPWGGDWGVRKRREGVTGGAKAHLHLPHMQPLLVRCSRLCFIRQAKNSVS